MVIYSSYSTRLLFIVLLLSTVFSDNPDVMVTSKPLPVPLVEAGTPSPRILARSPSPPVKAESSSLVKAEPPSPHIKAESLPPNDAGPLDGPVIDPKTKSAFSLCMP
ncbi:hypothetical protein FB446DRAFT_368592 [Lentinula raphanica]|nr:hypothetical protein FB446DRAFT_368592 [Lentinula raphanica]